MEIISKGATQHSEVDRSHGGHANKRNDGTRLRVGRQCDFQAQTKGRRTVHQHFVRRRLSKHFVVVDTPEHYTSQTCSVCHCQCGPFTELEEQRRKELKLKKEQERVGCSCTSDAKPYAHKRLKRSEGFAVAKTSNVESSCIVTETQRSTLRQTSVGCTLDNHCRGKRRQRISSW